MNRIVQFALTLGLLLSSMSGSAADLAVLRNGNSIRHEHRQVIGAVTRLYLADASSGYIEIPTDQIERFEKDTSPPPAAPTPTPAKAISTISARATADISHQDLTEIVSGAGARHQIDPDFISSVIRAESGFHQNAVSKKGAQGLMQLMPGTATQLGVSNPFDPNANVEGGTKYLRELLEKYNFDVPKALAAYNAGTRRVDQYHGIPPYYETQTYIARIIRDFNRKKLAENPALAQKMKAAHQGSGAEQRTAATSSSPKAGAVRTQKPKTAMADSMPQGRQNASQ